MKNPWTTLPGVIVLVFGLGVVAGSLTGWIDMPVPEAVVLGLVTVPTAVGLIRSRQDTVTSEESGAINAMHKRRSR